MFPFRQHEETAEILSLAGIRMVSLANNHMYDFNLLEGLKSTMDFLEGKLEYVGAGVGEEAYQYKIKEINGVKISFLGLSAVVDPGSMIAEGNKLGIAALPKIENYYENYYLNKLLRYVKKAKEQSDFNVILLHAGPTSGSEVSKCQRELAKILTENGVDVIIGTHSHAKQPINEIQDGYNKLKQVIFYGICNLVFGGRRNRQEESMIPVVRFSIDEMKRKNISYEYYEIQPNINGSFVPLVIK